MTTDVNAARARVAIAFATVLILLASGLLARHHEAEVSHVTDARTGVTSHAADAECHDSVLVSHFHALPSNGHTDECSQIAGLHQPIVFAKAVPIVTQTLVVVRATAPPRAITAQLSLLFAAPKTSPPSFV